MKILKNLYTLNCLCAAFIFFTQKCFTLHRPAKFLKTQHPFEKELIITDPQTLRSAAKDALLFFEGDCNSLKSKYLDRVGLTPLDAAKTLKWIVKVVDEDKKSGKFRILDPEFLNKNLKFIKWNGDVLGAKKANIVIPRGPDGGKLKNGRIKITSYAVFTVDGSRNKTKKFNTALYGYSKQKPVNKLCKNEKVLFLNDGRGFKIRPLVWLTHKDAKDALMQGSIIVRMPNGRRKMFNVHENREVAENRGGESRNRWFFREILNRKNSRREKLLRIIDHPWAVFAGDLNQLGLGKLIALKYKNPAKRRDEIRLGVLADTGEAFQNNLYQLDLYAGIFNSRDTFRKELRQLPNTSQAYFLVKK
ncbi:hypothetical protein ACFLY6_02300 [Candidatus Dependentiae bacterium]